MTFEEENNQSVRSVLFSSGRKQPVCQISIVYFRKKITSLSDQYCLLQEENNQSVRSVVFTSGKK